MPNAVLISSVAIACAACWIAGLRLFVKADIPARRKIVWPCVLLAIGVCVGIVLPMHQLRSKWLWALAILPLAAAADVWLFRSRRGLGYWLRACGFEVVTVFAAAAATRYALDLSGVASLVR